MRRPKKMAAPRLGRRLLQRVCVTMVTAAYARVPVNGKLPIGPMPISPLMLSPETAPVKESVSGIGLVMETFQATLSPLTVPSKISVELPSAPCVPVSVPPAALTDSEALRSPIGVLITRFQFPSTAICVSPMVQLKRRYRLSHRASPTVSRIRWRDLLPRHPIRRVSGARGCADAVADQDAERDILDGEG